MLTKKQRANAERIATLAAAFGHLPYNETGQTMRTALNLSVPCADLIRAGIVTGVEDSNDAVNDNAVADAERIARAAVERATADHGQGWWTESANTLL